MYLAKRDLLCIQLRGTACHVAYYKGTDIYLAKRDQACIKLKGPDVYPTKRDQVCI